MGEDRKLIGIDIGGTGIKMGAVEASDPSGDRPPRIIAATTLHGHDRVSFSEGGDMLLKGVRELLAKVGWKEAAGIGLGVPGLVARRDGVLHEAPNLPRWNGRNILEALRPGFDGPLRVDNDANAFALAEWMWGAGRGGTDVVFLTLGTGIGGGIVAGGCMVRGEPGYASEPGHIVIAPRGLRIEGGSAKEAEGYVGNKRIAERARLHPDFGTDALVNALDPLTPKGLFGAAESGSRVAKEVWEDVGAAVGELLVTLTNLLNPQRIVIGGGVAQAGKWIFDPARDYLRRHSLVARHAEPELVYAALGSDAGILGAAGLLLEAPAPPKR